MEQDCFAHVLPQHCQRRKIYCTLPAEDGCHYGIMTQAGERTLMEWPADQTLIIRVPHQLKAAFGRMMPVHLTTRGVTLTVGDLRTKAASALGVSVSELALNIGSAFLSADDTTIESLKSELDRGVKIDARLTGDGAAARSPRDSTRRSKSKTRAAAGGLELPTLGHSPTASSVNTTQSAPPNIEQSARAPIAIAAT